MPAGSFNPTSARPSRSSRQSGAPSPSGCWRSSRACNPRQYRTLGAHFLSPNEGAAHALYGGTAPVAVAQIDLSYIGAYGSEESTCTRRYTPDGPDDDARRRGRARAETGSRERAGRGIGGYDQTLGTAAEHARRAVACRKPQADHDPDQLTDTAAGPPRHDYTF